MVDRRTAGRSSTSDRDPSGELERLQQRLRLIGQAARLGFWEYDFETGELWTSDELAALYGVEPAELTWPEFVSRLHPDDVVAPLERPTPSYPFGESNEFFFRVRHADGSYRSIRSRSVTYGEGDVPVRKLGVHIDMSDDAMFRAARLSEANERLRHFAYMASHDLRSPVRGIRMILDFIAEDHRDSLPGEVLERLEMVAERAGRLDRLVVDMLDYASADFDDLGSSPVDPGELITEVVRTIDHRQCRIEVDAALDGEVRVAGRPLAGCIRNLVDNACRYHDKPAGTVTVAATVDGPWLRVDVVDDGPGIPAAQREHLFEPLRTSDPAGSSGLGLAHVHRVVERYRGSLDVETEPGAGTRFTLRWPVEAVSGEG